MKKGEGKTLVLVGGEVLGKRIESQLGLFLEALVTNTPLVLFPKKSEFSCWFYSLFLLSLTKTNS